MTRIQYGRGVAPHNGNNPRLMRVCRMRSPPGNCRATTTARSRHSSAKLVTHTNCESRLYSLGYPYCYLRKGKHYLKDFYARNFELCKSESVRVSQGAYECYNNVFYYNINMLRLRCSIFVGNDSPVIMIFTDKFTYPNLRAIVIVDSAERARLQRDYQRCMRIRSTHIDQIRVIMINNRVCRCVA